MSERPDIPRRDFLRSAVAIGGTVGLSACLSREATAPPPGPADLSQHPPQQHAWNDVLPTDEHGNIVSPRHHVLLYLNYRRNGRPTSEDRKTVETTLRGVEHAYERSGAGLLLTVSYSPAYFERFSKSLPESIDLPPPEPLAPFEQPILDTPDTVLHLASNHAQAILGAEAALTGTKQTLNGIDQPDSTLTEVFEISDRRTGFIGEGLPAKHTDIAAVPKNSPSIMGFRSGFARNQASEDRVTIQTGPFAGGTTQHISKFHINLAEWYEQNSHNQRVAKMFCPHHARKDIVTDTGEELGDYNRVGECELTRQAAREQGVVGHAQKAARVREDNQPIILRRDFDTVDGDQPGVHFLALQRGIRDFVATRTAMNGSDVTGDFGVGQRRNNGILQYIRTKYRGNYLIPPRSKRALPSTTPESDPI